MKKRRRFKTPEFIEALAISKPHIILKEGTFTQMAKKASFLCTIHNEEFSTPALMALKQNGCKECEREVLRYKAKMRSEGKSTMWDTPSALNKFESLEKFKCTDYSQFKYISGKHKSIFTCLKHNYTYEQIPPSHIKHEGCKYCSEELGEFSVKITSTKKNAGFVVDTESFISVASPIHNDFYIYEKTLYVSSKSKVTITCPTHGDFLQAPDKHLQGKGCRKCRIKHSHLENGVFKMLEDRGLRIIRNHFLTDPVTNKKQELDIFLPDFNIGIEVNGVYTHSTAKNRGKNYHIDKREFFESFGIRTIFLWEDEIKYNKDSVLSYLDNIFLNSKNEKVYARKCHIKNINNLEAKKFLDENHLLKSGGNSKNCIALFNEDGVMVSLMTFNRTYGKWTLTRMVNKKNTNVIGGFSKLLTYWRTNNPSEDLISFIDLDKFTGEAYFKSGFAKQDTEPTMWYVRRDRRESKHKYRHDKLKKLFANYDPNLTEKENCKRNNIHQAWNSGTCRVFLASIL